MSLNPMNVSSSLLELIQTRRTIHQFKSNPVDAKVIHDALALMRFIPNHHLTQSWHFYELGGQTKANLLNVAGQFFAHKNAINAVSKVAKWSKIPHWILVTQKITRHSANTGLDQTIASNPLKSEKEIQEDYASISAGLYAMMLFLHENGVGSKWSTGDVITTDEWYQACNIDSKVEKIVGLFWIGYPDTIPAMPPRRDVTHYVTQLP